MSTTATAGPFDASFMPHHLNMPRLRYNLCACVLALSMVANASAGEYHLMHEGIERAYDLYLPPSYKSQSAAPLVLVLHGRAGNGKRMADITGFNARADDLGFIVAYPEGLDRAWNYMHGIPGYRPGPDDPGFLLELVSTLSRQYKIDTARIYVTGISNGGFMAQRLACQAPSRFAAFASVAAGGYGAMPRACRDYRPVNILFIHGTDDKRVPWQGVRIAGSDGKPQQVTLSIADSVKFWSRRNRCGPEVTVQELEPKGNSPGTSVRILTASQCEDDTEVSLYAVLGGGHNWPGSRGVIPPRVAGRVNMDIHATDVILAFFQRHALTE